MLAADDTYSVLLAHRREQFSITSICLVLVQFTKGEKLHVGTFTLFSSYVMMLPVLALADSILFLAVGSLL